MAQVYISENTLCLKYTLVITRNVSSVHQ